MVPPPSAVMQPSMQTPAQSMLRRPAASAAVIACAASATSDSQCNTKSLVGRLHIESSRARELMVRVPFALVHMQRGRFREPARQPVVVLGLMEEHPMAYPNDPYRAPMTDDEIRRQARLNSLDNELQADPELAEGPASGGTRARFAHG